jgi:hypothetical protein
MAREVFIRAPSATLRGAIESGAVKNRQTVVFCERQKTYG